MTKLLLSGVGILTCLLLTGMRCQEIEDEEDVNGEDNGSWDRIWEAWQNFCSRVSSAFRDAWSDFTSEIKARTADIRGWTREAWEGFKQRMRGWIDQRDDVDESKRSEMRKFIERLEMPDETKSE